MLKEGDHVRVVSGSSQGIPLIIKWYLSHKRTIEYEANAYRELRSMGCPVPWFSFSYYCYGEPVLVLEKLQPLDSSDNEYTLGIHVLQQLRFVHRLGVHCDIKPQNVMKRQLQNDDGSLDVYYFLIDYGGLTRERLGYGYRRWLWSPLWTSQRSHTPNQITTYVNDFIELGYTMRALQNKRAHGSYGNFKHHYHGRLRMYMDYVHHLDPKRRQDNVYDELIKILSA
jgi:hypothetical protein